MKKRLLILIGFCLFSAFATQAQTRVGAFLAYGTEVENLGVGVNGEFYFNDKITLVPSFTFYMTDDSPGVNTSLWEANINGQFFFASEQTALIYGLAGLNYTHSKVEILDETDRNGELGINIGVGADFDINSDIVPFAQLKYVISDFDQLVLSGGVRFTLGR